LSVSVAAGKVERGRVEKIRIKMWEGREQVIEMWHRPRVSEMHVIKIASRATRLEAVNGAQSSRAVLG
jgi:hypothetical protein